MILRFFILAMLVKILLISELPFLCSGLYSILIFVISMMLGRPLGPTVVVCLIAFALSSIYFWVLDRYNESGLIWWIILLVGAGLIGMV